MAKMTRKEYLESKQKEKKESVRCCFCLTENEHKGIIQKARELNISRSVYIRSILFYKDE